VSPQAGIDPVSTEQAMADQFKNALQSKGLVP
jgi:hypothetical protein